MKKTIIHHQPILVSAETLSVLMEVSVTTIYKLTNEKVIPSVIIGKASRRYIPQDVLQALKAYAAEQGEETQESNIIQFQP